MSDVLLAIVLLMVPILLAGTAGLLVPLRQERMRLTLAFSAGYLFSISIMHMLPEVFNGDKGRVTGLFIVAGFCLQLLMDTFSAGIEHGHVHLHSHDCNTHMPRGIVIGLFLHSLIEGLPVYDLQTTGQHHINFQLVLGLAVHNLPITIAFAALLRDHESSHVTRWLLIFSFSLMTPVGYLVSHVVQTIGLQGYDLYARWAYALVIGIFLHISTAIMFESGVHHKYNARKILVMSVGIVVAYLIS